MKLWAKITQRVHFFCYRNEYVFLGSANWAPQGRTNVLTIYWACSSIWNIGDVYRLHTGYRRRVFPEDMTYPGTAARAATRCPGRKTMAQISACVCPAVRGTDGEGRRRRTARWRWRQRREKNAHILIIHILQIAFNFTALIGNQFLLHARGGGGGGMAVHRCCLGVQMILA